MISSFRNTLKGNLITFYIGFAFLTIAYSLPHAVLTIVLLNKGIMLSQIMLIQAIYSFAVLISEYPSGLLADMYSKKLIFLISKGFILVMFILVIYMNSFVIMALAWFLYGISSALDSGTIDVELINNMKEAHRSINGFIKNANRLNFISLLIGSSIGSFTYYKFGIRFYWISVIFTVACAFIIILFFKENKSNNRCRNWYNPFKLMVQESKDGLKEVSKKESLKLMILLTFVGQFFFQAHFQMWQAIFLVKGLNKHNFYLIYIVFQILSILAYSVHLSKLKKYDFKIKGFIFLFVFILLLFMLKITNGLIFMLFYVIWVFVFTIFDYLSNYLFSKYVSQRRISSLTSLKSSCGRIASLLSMLECGFLLNYISVTNVVIINFAFSAVMSLWIVKNYLSIRKNISL